MNIKFQFINKTKEQCNKLHMKNKLNSKYFISENCISLLTYLNG